MKRSFLRWSATAVLAGLFIVLSPGCVVGGEYGYEGNVGIGLGYYEPYGIDYGGWGPGYHVAPSRGNDRSRDRGAGQQRPPTYRPAPGSHTVPTIPSRPRPGNPRPNRPGSH